MLIYKLQVVIQILPLLTITQGNDDTDSNNSSTTEDYEKQLIEANNGYYKYSQGDHFVINKETIVHYLYGESILHKDIQTMESNLIYIFKQLYNFFHQMIPKRKEVEDSIAKNRHTEYTIEGFHYLDTICLYVPRILDFVYLCTPTLRSLIEISYLHSLLCSSWRKTIAKRCPVNEHNSKVRLCVENDVIDFYSVLKLDSFTHVIMQDDYQQITETYIKSISKIIDEIDKTKTVRNTPWYTKYIFVSQVSLPSFNIKLNQPKRNFQQDQNEYQSKYQSLLTSFDLLLDDNENLIKEIDIPSLLNKSYDTDQPETMISNRMNEILLYILKGLKHYFLDNFFNSFDDGTAIIHQNELENIVSKMFDELCVNVPLILYFLNENQCNDTELYGSYFSLCSDWMIFFNHRCPREALDSMNWYVLKCIVRSAQEKLLLNDFMITKSKTYDENHIKNDQKKMRFTELLKNFNLLLNTFYEGKTVHQWSSIDWLSGKYFFTKDHSSKDLNKIKSTTITIGDQLTTFDEVYHQLLPWNSNLKTILIFHNLYMGYIDETMEIYVKQQAKIILLYFEYMNNTVWNTVLLRLTRTFKWYTLGTDISFIHYLNSPAISFSTQESASNIIAAVENISKKTKESIIEIRKNILKEEEIYLEQWVENTLTDTDKNNFIKNLNNILFKNCEDASTLIDNFTWIVEVSKKKNSFADEGTCKLLCSENNKDIFVDKDTKMSAQTSHSFSLNESVPRKAWYQKLFGLIY